MAAKTVYLYCPNCQTTHSEDETDIDSGAASGEHRCPRCGEWIDAAYRGL